MTASGVIFDSIWPVIFALSAHLIGFTYVIVYELKSNRTSKLQSLMWILIAWFIPILGPLGHLVLSRCSNPVRA